MNKIIVVAGVFSLLLGGLWVLQGLGLVHIRPILCFADCEPIQGASLTWIIIGTFFVAAGVLAMVLSLKRRTRS
jgi:hypothetical protein